MDILVDEGPGHLNAFEARVGAFAFLRILELLRESVQELIPDILDIVYRRIQSREPVHCSVDPFIDEGSLDVSAGNDDFLDP